MHEINASAFYCWSVVYFQLCHRPNLPFSSLQRPLKPREKLVTLKVELLKTDKLVLMEVACLIQVHGT